MDNMLKIEQGVTPGVLPEGGRPAEIGAGKLPFLGSGEEGFHQPTWAEENPAAAATALIRASAAGRVELSPTVGIPDPIEDYFAKMAAKPTGLKELQEFLARSEVANLAETAIFSNLPGLTFGEYKKIVVALRSRQGIGKSVEEIVREVRAAASSGVHPSAAQMAAILGRINPEALRGLAGGLTPEMAQLGALAPERLMGPGAEEYLQGYYDAMGMALRRADMAEKYGIPLSELPPQQKLVDVVFVGPRGELLFGSDQPQARIHHLEAAMAAADVAGLTDQTESRRLQFMLGQDPDQPTIETSIFHAMNLMKAAGKGEGYSSIEQFEQAMRPALRREGLRGMEQMRFKLCVEAVVDEATGRKETFMGDLSPAHFLNVIDDPEFASRLLEAGWGEKEKILLNPDESPSLSKNYVVAISDLYNEVFARYLRNTKGEGLPKEARIIDSNAYHFGFKTRISFDHMRSLPVVASQKSVRDLLIGPFWGMYKGAFDTAFYFGRFSAWSKTAKGRITMPELRKAYLPHIYYGLLYTEGVATNEDLMTCAYWHDLWTMKLDKLFPGFEAKFNGGNNTRTLEQVRKSIENIERRDRSIYWIQEWDGIAQDAIAAGGDPVAAIQQEILKRHTTRMGYAPAWNIMGSMVVSGLKGKGPFAKQNIYIAIKWMDQLKSWYGKAAEAYNNQRLKGHTVKMIEKLGAPGLPPNNGGSSNMSDEEHRQLLDRVITRHAYDYFFKGPVGEMLSFSEMSRVPWTKAEEIIFQTADFTHVLSKIGQNLQSIPAEDRTGKRGFFRMLGVTFDQNGGTEQHGDGVGFQHMQYERLEDKDLGSQTGYAAAASASALALYKLGVATVSNEPIQQYGAMARINLDLAIGKSLGGVAEDFLKAMAYFDQSISLRLLRDIPIIVANSAAEARIGAVSYALRTLRKYGTTHYTYDYQTVKSLDLNLADVRWLLDRTWQVSAPPSRILQGLEQGGEEVDLSKVYVFNPSRDPVRRITYVSNKGTSLIHEQYGGRMFGHEAIAHFAEALSDTARLNGKELALALAGIHAASAIDKTQMTDAERIAVAVTMVAEVGGGAFKKMGG